MSYTYKQLNPAVIFNAIYTYCKHMNCVGLEEKVEIFLESKAGRNIRFDEEGYIILHNIS